MPSPPQPNQRHHASSHLRIRYWDTSLERHNFALQFYSPRWPFVLVRNAARSGACISSIVMCHHGESSRSSSCGCPLTRLDTLTCNEPQLRSRTEKPCAIAISNSTLLVKHDAKCGYRVSYLLPVAGGRCRDNVANTALLICTALRLYLLSSVARRVRPKTREVLICCCPLCYYHRREVNDLSRDLAATDDHAAQPKQA